MHNTIDREQIKKLVSELLQSGEARTSGTSSPTVMIDESLKDVITESEVRDLPHNSQLLVKASAIFTPSAQDLINARQITLSFRKSSQRSDAQRIIALGADHGGFEMKEHLKEMLHNLGYQFRDFGTNSNEAVDYPDYAHAVAAAVANGACDVGIILDGAGIGSCMTANKVPGVRAAMCYDTATAKNSREHNYANVLTLGAKMISNERMQEIVLAWLATDEGEARHGKRVAKIMTIEKQYLKS